MEVAVPTEAKEDQEEQTTITKILDWKFCILNYRYFFKIEKSKI